MNQPKYITYRGAKYERVNTLNEIRVDPTPPHCCLLVVGTTRGETDIYTCEFKNEPAGKVAQDYLHGGEYFTNTPVEEDQYSYYAFLYEEVVLIVCTRGRGAFGYLYDLAKKWKDLEKSYTADPDAVDPDDVERAGDDLYDALDEKIYMLNEIKVDPIPPLTIQSIELASNQHTGDAFAALGVNYNVTLSNKKIVQANDDELLGRYAKEVPRITQGRKSPKELTDLLKGKLWDKDY